MKRTINSLRIALSLALLLSCFSLKAQTTPVNSLSDLNTGTLGMFCRGDQVKLTAASDGTTFVWKRYDGPAVAGTATTLSSTSANLIDSPTGAGYYTYVATGYNADGCESSSSDPVTIYMLPGITAAIVSNDPSITKYCTSSVPTAITLTATAGKAQAVSETFGYKYQWYKNGTAISGATDPTYTLSSTNDATVGSSFDYTVKVTYQAKACTETESTAINFKVIALPTKPVVTLTP